MVSHVKLVFTTLAILNFFGIVASQDKLEHNLPTDCFGKSKKTYQILKNSSKFNYIPYCFLGKICGDKCFWNNCKCGDDGTFDSNKGSYCCIPLNETCTTQSMLR